jgi:HAD superfamily hydrolase (TIGR01509 family)
MAVSKAIKAVVFDVGGVLADNLQWYVGWGEQLAATPELREQVEAVRLEGWRRLREDPAGGEEGFWQEVLTAAHLADRFTPQQCNAFLQERFRPHFATIALAQRLAARGYLIAICSNHSKGWFEEIVTRFCLRHVFQREDLIIASYAVGCSKPSHDIYQIVHERLQRYEPTIAREEVVLVDDQRKNITAAEAFGLHGVLFDADVQPPLYLVDALVQLGVRAQEAERD